MDSKAKKNRSDSLAFTFLFICCLSTFPIGEEIERELERCNSPKCSEIPVRYRNAHIDQILKLIEDSGSCSQELQFHCNNGTLTNVSNI